MPQRFGTDYAIYQSGSGGDVAYSNDIPVSPGEVLLVTVGNKWPFKELGTSPNPVRRGYDTYLKRGDQTLLLAKGGDSLSTSIGDKVNRGGAALSYTTSSQIRDIKGASSAFWIGNGNPSVVSSWWGGDGVDLKGGRVPAYYSDAADYGGGAAIYSNTRRLGNTGQGAIRIMWDVSSEHQRSFPYDAGDV